MAKIAGISDTANGIIQAKLPASTNSEYEIQYRPHTKCPKPKNQPTKNEDLKVFTEFKMIKNGVKPAIRAGSAK